MRKISLFLSLCAGVILSASLCVNVLLYQRLAATGNVKKQQKGARKTIPGKRKTLPRVPAPVKPSVQNKTLICLSASGNIGENNKPMIRLCFNKWNVDWAKNHTLISVKPAVKIQYSNFYDEIRMHGNFEYEKEYSVFLKKGIRSDSGDVLEHDLSFRIRIPSLPPEVRFVSDGMIYPSGRKELFLPVEVTNLKEFRVRVYELYENNLTRFTRSYWGSSSVSRNGRLISDKKVKCSPVRNRVISHKLKLSDYIKDCRSGVYSVEISHGSSYYNQSRVINLTDLSCSIALDKTMKKAAVAVRSLKNSSSEAGASVILISEKHQILARGVTDQNGIVLLDYSRSSAGKDKEDFPEYLFVKSSAGKVTILRNISSKEHSLAPFQNQGMVYTGKIRAFLYTERGIYRPGEKLFLNLFLRDGSNRVCSNMPCSVRIRDPKGNTIYSARMKSSQNGFVSAFFTLPAESRSGSYEIVCTPDRNADELEWGKTSFLVSDFTPDRIKVQLKSSEKTLYRGGKLSFDITARHYYGAPLEKAPCRVMVTAQKAVLPAAWDNWSVGDGKAFRAGKTDSSAKQLLKGKRSFTYKGFEECGGQASFPVLLCASAQVRDPGGRTVTARRNVLYHPLDHYIGLREGRDPASRHAAVEWKLLPADGKKLSGKTMRSWKVTLSRLEWHSVMRRVGSDLRLDWEQRKIPMPEMSSSFRTDDPEGVWKKELESGQYEILFEEGPRRSVLQFYHWRGDDSPRSTNPSVIHCFADRKLYKRGEVATLTFHSAGDGVLLVTLADPRLLSMKSVKVKAGENTVRIRIPSSVPGSSFYCGLTLVSGEKRQFGLVHLPVDQSAGKLSVALECPAKAAPGEKLKVKLSLKDSAGKPAAGVVQVFAVEEGILSLTGYRTPDIFGFFFGRYRCDLLFADVYSTLYPELKITSSGRFGGDRAMAVKASLSFLAGPEGEDPSRHAPRSVVCMLPPMEINGSGEVVLDIPDHLGSLRLMAVASGKSAVGSTGKNIVVRARADMEISGPRICAPSDKAQLTFTLLNSDIPGGKGVFRAKLPSGKMYEKEVRILPGKSLVLRVPVQMPASEGICRIPCELVLDNAVRKKVFSCGVRLPVPLVRHTLLRMLKSGERFLPGRELLKADFAYVKESSLSFSPSPAEALRDALEFLNEYPYGCLEQTVSAVFPYLAVRDLAAYGIITPSMAETAQLKLKNCISKIRSMMLYSGAFPMWQGQEEPWISGSVFASHFLCESKGFEESARRRNQLFLRSVASRRSNSRYERAYAVYVLSLMKDPSSVKYARDLLDPAKDDFASLPAAFALLERAYAGEGAVHLSRLLKKGVFQDNTAPHFTSEASRKGMVLYLLMKYGVEKEHSAALALDLVKLLRKDSSSWGVTHANAWAALGLASYLRESGSSGKGKLLVREFPGSKGTAYEVSKSLSLPVKKNVLKSLEVENVSNGSVFVRLCVRGQSRNMPVSGKGMTLKRVYYNSKGKAVSGAAQGELLTVELTVTGRGPLKDLVISDMLPGGLEIEDDALQTRMKMQKKYDQGILNIKHVEKRNGLMILCADLPSKGIGRFRYQVRAVTRGTFASGIASAEGMYDPETFARTGADQKAFEVR